MEQEQKRSEVVQSLLDKYEESMETGSVCSSDEGTRSIISDAGDKDIFLEYAITLNKKGGRNEKPFLEDGDWLTELIPNLDFTPVSFRSYTPPRHAGGQNTNTEELTSYPLNDNTELPEYLLICMMQLIMNYCQRLVYGKPLQPRYQKWSPSSKQ